LREGGVKGKKAALQSGRRNIAGHGGGRQKGEMEGEKELGKMQETELVKNDSLKTAGSHLGKKRKERLGGEGRASELWKNLGKKKSLPPIAE